ncbi:MAG: methionine gamma-lyase [Spirochaetaceae bacterium]|nr:methionine gamma-lyase [Spirochaetaceae bacterium]
MNKEKIKSMGFATKSIHGGFPAENTTGALTTPIYQTATFSFDSAEQGGRIFSAEEEGYLYSRVGNPTTAQLEERLAILEGAEASLALSSGMGAITAALWTILKAGDHIVSSRTIYGCTHELFEFGLSRFNVDVSFVDMTDPDNVRKAMRKNTRLIFVETPANPNLILNDIEAISAIAHEKADCLVMADNTFATPYLQLPLALGADIVVHSATKYLNGHGDVIAGFVAGKKELMDEIRVTGLKYMTGAVLAPFDAFLIIRGLKTLDIRMERHCDNGEAIADFLEGHQAVEKVYFPGLKDFPQFDLAAKQMKRPGAIISFEVKGGFENGKKVINAVELCRIAVSLGDAETLIQHPASMTHLAYNDEDRHKAGISDGLIRLSVGLENAEDIIADLKQSLDRIL